MWVFFGTVLVRLFNTCKFGHEVNRVTVTLFLPIVTATAENNHTHRVVAGEQTFPTQIGNNYTVIFTYNFHVLPCLINQKCAYRVYFARCPFIVHGYFSFLLLLHNYLPWHTYLAGISHSQKEYHRQLYGVFSNLS